MARTSGSSLPILYLGVSKEGRLYEVLKVHPSDEEIARDRNLEKMTSDAGNVSVRRYYDSTDFGTIEYVGIVEVKFNGKPQKKLLISVNNGESIDCITVNLLTTSKNLTGYVKNLATLLPNIDFSRRLSITPSKKVNDRGYADSNFFINYEDDRSLVQFAHMYGDKGDIPPTEKDTDAMGQTTTSYKAQDRYLYDILSAQIERFKEYKASKNGSQTTEKPQTTQATQPQNTESQPVNNAPDNVTQVVDPQADMMNGDINDDLPF